MTTSRISIKLADEMLAALNDAAKQPGASRAAVIDAALTAYFSPENRHSSESAIIRRLDLFDRRLGRFERAQLVMLEAFALYLRYFFFYAPEVAGEARKAVLARAKLRLADFIDELGGDIASDKSFTRYLLDEFEASEEEFFTEDEIEALGRVRERKSSGDQSGGAQ